MYAIILLFIAYLVLLISIHVLVVSKHKLYPIKKYSTNLTPESQYCKPLLTPLNLCDSDKIEMVILIHSSMEKQSFRDQIRKYTKPWLTRWKVLFVVGISENSDMNRNVRHEYSQHNDILQGDFIDTYRNLTLKHIFGMSCAVKHCSNVRFVLKADDDIFVNYYLLEDYLDTINVHSLEYSIICNKFLNGVAIREEASKWYVSPNEFTSKYYPPYCSGWGYLTSINTFRILLTQVENKPFFWIDDVYVTGILRQQSIQISLIDVGHLFNVFPNTLLDWLNLKGSTEWKYMFSNTNNNQNNLQMALKLNHQYYNWKKTH